MRREYRPKEAELMKKENGLSKWGRTKARRDKMDELEQECLERRGKTKCRGKDASGGGAAEALNLLHERQVELKR